MQKTTKIIVTIVAVVVFFFLSLVISGLRSDAGFATPGIFCVILLFALIGALKAIWKKNDNNGDDTALQK